MNSSRNPQYLAATTAAMIGLITYGLMRHFSEDSFVAWGSPSNIPFYLSLLTAALVLTEHILLRKYNFLPLVVGLTMVTGMTLGAYISTEWEYYFLATLGMVGVMCLYGKVRAVIIYQLISVILNIIVIAFLLEGAPAGFHSHMINSFVLCLFSSVFLIALLYRANKKEGVAHGGLQAFSALLSSTPNLMVIVDGKRRVRYISAPLAKFAGLDEVVAIGRPLVDLFKSESLKLMFADILDAENFYSATREIDVNDEPHYFKIIADKLSDSDEGMFIEITDMTEIVLASIKADEARKEAEIANKSKSAFLATMSHEIRTPMNAIIGVSEIQLMREDLPDDVVNALKQIHMSSHGLLGIINDILDLSKIETGKLEISPQEYDVPSLINDAVQLNIIRIGSKPLVFTLDVSENLPARLIGDEMRLKQILNNILSNAFKYTSRGSVKLSVSHHPVPHGIELVFRVADTGQGMRQEDLARLFEEYSRFNENANRATEGTGLGMNITRRLVDMMDGRIEVESEYGKGSIFTVTVMQCPATSTDVIGPEHAAKLRNFTYVIDKEALKTQINRDYMPYGKVLIVDDVDTNLYVAKGLLTPYGLNIETATSGFETIEKIMGGAVYDLVFMDHMMPKMDGVETTIKLRESGYQGTIVALTANAIAGNDKYFRECGFDEFISKPIDMRQMNAVLNRYVRDKHEQEKNAAPLPPAKPPAAAGIDKDLFEIFKRDAQRAIANLSQTMADGDFKLFTITAHAMKSACLNVEQAELSQLAKELEQAGNQQDLDFITQHGPKLIEGLKQFITEAEPVAAAEAAAEGEAREGATAEDSTSIRQLLEQISQACEDYDSNQTRALLKEIKDKPLSAEIRAGLDEIADLVLCSDFDEAAELAGSLAKISEPSE